VPEPEERIAALLGRHYVTDRFDADELGRRLDLAYAGETQDALAGLAPLADTAPKRRWGRRHGESGAADPSWVPTKERFLDPSTQRVMRVWVDPADHMRHYVAEPAT
jgi:hypothetical protein